MKVNPGMKTDTDEQMLCVGNFCG